MMVENREILKTGVFIDIRIYISALASAHATIIAKQFDRANSNSDRSLPGTIIYRFTFTAKKPDIATGK